MEGTLEQVSPCRKCNSLSGWYEKRICKYTQIFEANGDAFDACNMVRVRGGDRRFCVQCHRDITDLVQVVVA